jgi:hypothetical protein
MKLTTALAASVLCAGMLVQADVAWAQAPGAVEYRVLATNKTAFGGSEVVVVMVRNDKRGSYGYRLLATNKTSTMQKEMQDAGDAGYEYRGQTVFKSTFGGKEVVVILERDGNAERPRYQYKLLSTSKTSTLQKELSEAGDQGFDFVGLTVAETAIGGNEVVAILRRHAR